MQRDALLEYTGRCACWFRANIDPWQPQLSVEQIAELLHPPIDSERTCKTSMTRYLMREGNMLEGVLFPEATVAGLQLLRENSRSLAFNSVKA